jgi:signal transduction histidine kinase
MNPGDPPPVVSPPARLRHDLLTPLNGVIGYAGILLEDAADLGRDEMLERLEDVRSGARALADAVRTGLDGRMDDGAMVAALDGLREQCGGPARGLAVAVRALRTGLGEEDAAALGPDLDHLATSARAFVHALSRA